VHLLLDTHIFLWMVSDDDRLSDTARSLIQKAESRHISAASLWEIAIKARLGKLRADVDELLVEIGPSGVVELPVTSRHAAEVGRLPLHHTDPFDRMLIAQSICEPLYLLTADEKLSRYGSLVIHV
jgi:PIN domain nuclease of toxin-antitoxin system